MDGGDEMIHGLSEEEKFKVIRPMLGEHMLGDYGMPIIHLSLIHISEPTRRS